VLICAIVQLVGEMIWGRQIIASQHGFSRFANFPEFLSGHQGIPTSNGGIQYERRYQRGKGIRLKEGRTDEVWPTPWIELHTQSHHFNRL
jgi:hypothetical protein